MAQLERKDDQALAALYDRYGVAVYSMAYRVLGTKESAEEVAQDVFLYVWKHPSMWDPQRGKLISWLLTVTRNRAIDRLRKERRGGEALSTPLDELPYLTAQQDERMGGTNWANGRLMQQLINELPGEQATLIELAFFKGMTHSEIAGATKIPLGTVKTRLRSGLKRLRGLWMQETDAVKESGQDET